MDPFQSFKCNTNDVVFENFGDEVILLNLKSGKYYSLDPVGMAYWEWLSQEVPPDQIAAHASKTFGGVSPNDIQADLHAFLEDCVQEELLTRSDLTRGITEVAGEAKLPLAYMRPTMSVHDDIADMLLLDPVHDVAEAGWPQQAPKA